MKSSVWSMTLQARALAFSTLLYNISLQIIGQKLHIVSKISLTH